MSKLDGLEVLFPAPSQLPSRLSPSFWPGSTPGSTAALQSILKDDYRKWHVYFNPQGFHNHTIHHALALWALGADEEVLKAGYKNSSGYQQPAFVSPEGITPQNFNEHLGDEKFYAAYLQFFIDVVRKKGTSAILEEYIFSPKANFVPGEAKQPEMLNRLLEGLVHPMIQVGYGAEFGLPGVIAEGLAQAAVHRSGSTALLPASLFEGSAGVDVLGSRLASGLVINDTISPEAGGPSGTHALTILARILSDHRFHERKAVEQFLIYQTVMDELGDILRDYADQWSLDMKRPGELQHKIEELVWANTIIYGIGGWTKGEDLNADFLFMHLVTSSLFLSSLTAYLSPSSQALLLRSYFSVSLAWWVAHGRPGFDIKGFFEADLASPAPPGPLPTPNEKALPSPSSAKAITPNPWLPIIQTTLVHPDEHLAKIQRALAHYAVLYGTRVAGLPDFTGTELAGAEHLNGTLFIRVAGLTSKRVGHVREGEPSVFWDRRGF